MLHEPNHPGEDGSAANKTAITARHEDPAAANPKAHESSKPQDIKSLATISRKKRLSNINNI